MGNSENTPGLMPDLVTAARLIKQQKLTSVALVTRCLRSIESHNPTLNAFGDVYADAALCEAEACDRETAQGISRGPLHGVPFGIKDLFSTAGLRTTKGSLSSVDVIPDSDAPVITRLKAAGGIILGKTATTEFGWTGSSFSRLFGHGRNPWNPTLTSGGSSSGSAISVAARMVPAALGSDGGGSVRIPGAFCGIFALKGSLGRIPTWPWSATEMLSHAGPMTRTVRDSALLFDILSGPDARDHQALPDKGESYLARCNQPLKPLRVHFSPTLFDTPVSPAIASRVKQAVNLLAHALPVEIRTETLTWQSPFETFNTLWTGGRGIAYGAALANQLDQLDPGFADLITRSANISLADYLAAQKQRAAFANQVHALFDDVDLLITPTLPILPFAADRHTPVDQPEGESGVEWARWTPFTWPFNLSGNPAATLPCGFTPEGLPVGLQVVGRRYAEGDVLQFCAALEALMPWDQHLPPVLT
ncbi:amidase family protein [Pantoea sp. LMR881]|uniref:amidase n=1 Tax=Pantoea sp. LMR881 TaxID=3014336 RepID=UPI0022B0120D|nr:amidase family protein [Pantoea sp. LMR881]MCZ4057896.1 amidase family protein [Pantoea sp. LMR881]